MAFDPQGSVAGMVFLMAEGTENSYGYLHAAAVVVVVAVAHHL